ncbi:hypothetical protein AB6A40_006518 [Gnathostoma spinigerum]|uniref:HMG box domain-containing protein n=1 Tax=Gnathostoma spinigerum TaxID=75299 RepID=A0ABD6ENT0_9BILA
MVSKKNKPHSKHSYPSKSLGKVETTLSLDPLCSYESVAASALLSNCREKVGVVYNYELFKSARVSGGFKLFIEKVNDEIFDIIVEDVLRKKKNYGGPSSIERVAKSLRYAWKQMSLSTRSQWEMEARIRIKEAIKRTPNNGEGRNTVEYKTCLFFFHCYISTLFLYYSALACSVRLIFFLDLL